MRVSLVGAGPGDRGLLTIKGAERIQNADVVLYDRFVSEDILAMIPSSAEKINVGKTVGNHPVPQDEINQLLLHKAKQGHTVVRLKGGDPFVFGRGGEELELLAKEGNIPFEVVPGISSAIAGAAYAGIPVTHRNYSSSLHIITGHAKNNEEIDIDYEALVRTKGTLVFMMSVASLEEICTGCINAGMDKKTPAAIVENATTSAQRKFLGTVGTILPLACQNNVLSPAIIIIGEVCSLSESYDWFGKKPLLGKRLMVARAKPGVSRLSECLRELGCHVTELPPAQILPIASLDKLLKEEIDSYAWLVFTSSIGVSVFFEQLIKSGLDIRMLHHLKIACVGPETENELMRYGIRALYRPAEYNGAALAEGLVKRVKSGERLLIARAKDGVKDLTDILAKANISFRDVKIYEKKYHIKKLSYSHADYVAFTSSSAVESFVQSFVEMDYSSLKVVCIGERTASTARTYGMKVFISAEATVSSMVDKIKELCADDQA